MKTTRKILAVVFAVVMVLVMSLPVSATGTGSITVTNATTGKDYSAYKVFDLTYNNDNVAYTYTKTGASDAFYTALTAVGSPFTLTATTNADVYNVSTSETAENIAAWLKNNESLLGSAAATTEATSENVLFTGLDFGYYYVTSELGSAVTLTSAKPSASIVDKNQKPGAPDSEHGYKSVLDGSGNLVESFTADYGDEVTFQLRATATNYDGAQKITQYVAHDLPGVGYDNITITDVQVKVGETTYALRTGAEAAGYNYTYTSSTNDSTGERTVTIPWTVGSAADGAFIYTNGGTTSAEIVVTLTATVTSASDTRTNTGWFTWTGHETAEEEEKDPIDVKSYSIAIDKYDSADNTAKLENAEFVLKNASDEYYNLTGGVVSWVASQDNATVFTTDPNGAAEITGLKNGTYTVMETKAPDGYVLAINGTDVTINDANGTASISNTKGSTTPLPETGGVGTVLFITFGMIAVVVTGVFLVTNKRMSKEDI